MYREKNSGFKARGLTTSEEPVRLKEDEAGQARIHGLIIEVYKRFACPMAYVPVRSPGDRVDLILKNADA